MTTETVDSDGLTHEEMCALSCFMPNLACVIEREPPKMVEETRLAARQELAAILRELRAMRPVVRAAIDWEQNRVEDDDCYDKLEIAASQYREKSLTARLDPGTVLVHTIGKLVPQLLGELIELRALRHEYLSWRESQGGTPGA